MASTTTQPHNAAVKFRGQREREMAKTENPMADDSMPKPPTFPKKPGPKYGKRVRKRARIAAKRGLISPKAMAKHMGE